jgi:hypothetical protein
MRYLRLFALLACVLGSGVAEETPLPDDPREAAAALLEQSRGVLFEPERYPWTMPAELPAAGVLSGWLVYGSGHGFSLDVIVVRLAGDALALDRFPFKDSLIRKGPEPAWPDSEGRQPQLRATLDAGHGRRLADILRWIASASITAVPPDDEFGVRRMSSSSDIVMAMELATGGQRLAARVCGYRGSALDEISLRPGAVRLAIARCVDAAAWQPVATTDADRNRFSDVFLALVPEFGQERYWWWVKERSVVLSAGFGDRRLIPFLLAQLDRAGDASVARCRYESVSALAGITGSDFRFGEDGKSKPLEAVMDAYRAALEAERKPGGQKQVDRP